MICTSLAGCASILLQLLVYGVSNGAVIALNALGVTLVYSVVRTVNFAYGDLFAHVVDWRGVLYLEDGLHRAVRAALQQRAVLHARVLVIS